MSTINGVSLFGFAGRSSRSSRIVRGIRESRLVPSGNVDDASVIKYSRTIGRFPSGEDFVPAVNGNGESGCILTTHTLIVNPVSDTDRTPYRGKGSSLNLFIRIPAVLSRCNRAKREEKRERGEAVRATDFETRTPCQNSLHLLSSPRLSLVRVSSSYTRFHISRVSLPYSVPGCFQPLTSHSPSLSLSVSLFLSFCLVLCRRVSREVCSSCFFVQRSAA